MLPTKANALQLNLTQSTDEENSCSGRDLFVANNEQSPGTEIKDGTTALSVSMNSPVIVVSNTELTATWKLHHDASGHEDTIDWIRHRYPDATIRCDKKQEQSRRKLTRVMLLVRWTILISVMISIMMAGTFSVWLCAAATFVLLVFLRVLQYMQSMILNYVWMKDLRTTQRQTKPTGTVHHSSEPGYVTWYVNDALMREDMG
jgi:hypothetical protein